MIFIKGLDVGRFFAKARAVPRERRLAPKGLLVCGLLAALIWTGTDLYASLRYAGYRYPVQVISDLSAVGAPTREFVSRLDLVYVGLKIAFALGIWMSAGHKRALRLTAAALFASGVVDLVVSFFPWNPAERGDSLNNLAHALLAGAANVLLMLIAIGLSAGAGSRPFRVYAYGTLLVLLGSGGLMALLDSPRLAAATLAANLPPPGFGLAERISGYGFMLWMMVLALGRLRREPAGAPGRPSQGCRPGAGCHLEPGEPSRARDDRPP